MKRKIFYLIMSIFAISLFSQEIIQFEELEKHFKKDKIFQEILNKDIDFSSPKYRDNTTGYDMVIITNQYLKNVFEDFAEIKTREGVRTFVVTTQTTGSDSLSIRNWLKSKIQGTSPIYPDLKYVLIGGDETIVPTTKLPYFYGNYDKSFSSDFYYANVLHSFPIISNENEFQNIEFEEDLIVGRIPVTTPAQVQYFIFKYKNYFKYSIEEASNWKFFANNLVRVNGNDTSTDIINTIIENCNEQNTEIITEVNLVNATIFNPNLNNSLQGSMTKFINEINEQDFSFMYSIAHGSPEIFEIGDAQVDTSSDNYRRDGHATMLTNNVDFATNGFHNQHADYHAASYFLYNDFVSSQYNKPYVAMYASCSTANLCATETDRPVAQDLFTASSAVLLQTSSCLDYPNFTRKLRKYTMENFSSANIGELRKQVWDNLDPRYYNSKSICMLRLSDIIFGDPSMQILSKNKGNLVIKKRLNSYQVVDESGNPVPNAKLVLIDEYGNYITESSSPLTYPDLGENVRIYANAPNYVQKKVINGYLSKQTKIPYSMTFEEGIDEHWDMYSNITYGRIQVTKDYSPASGEKHLTMDCSHNGTYAINKASLNMDLTGETRVFLTFDWKDFGDEDDYEDGIYLSDDEGNSFTKVHSLTTTNHNTWIHKELNISELASENGLTLNNRFVIKFQQKDNYSIGSDGFAFDNIEVKKKYASKDYSINFENGLDEYWEIESNNSYGRIQVTDQFSPFSGTKHLTMDVSTSGNYAQNDAKLFINLSDVGTRSCHLKFRFKEFGDENHTQDGVYFSDDGGLNFTKVYALNGSSYLNNVWNLIDLDVKALCSSNGLTLSDQFVVKFTQYDNYSISSDGFAFDDICFEYSGIIEKKDNAPILTTISHKVFPNPFSKKTRSAGITISYVLPEKSNVNVSIFNIRGQKVKQFDSEVVEKGNHSVIWDCKDSKGNLQSTGVYFYQIRSKSESKTGKFIIMQ